MPFFLFGVLMPKSDINLKTTTSPKVKSNTVISIHGKDITTYQGKLDYAHQCGLGSITSRIIQFPVSENSNTCVCEAVVKTSDGRVFSDIGDASPDNVPRGCMNRIIGVASTRAKSRALSDAFNISSSLDDMDESSIIDITAVQDSSPELCQDMLSVQQNADTGDADKSKMQGGGLKSISAKQMNFIEKLASRQRITGDELAISIVNKSLEQLTGAEADFIIKSVKNNIIL